MNVKFLDKLFIGGQWVAPSSDGKIEVVSPVTEEVMFSVAEAREADMDRAVAAARKAFDSGPWPRMSPAERGAFLARFGEGLKARDTELSHAYTDQVGALYSFAQGVGVRAGEAFKLYADLATRFEFEERRIPATGGGRALLVREPVGVVAGIVPWNAALALSVRKVATALLAGCTIILKSSPEAPLDAYIMAEVAEAIGLPPGVLNVVVAHRPASEHLVRNPGVDKVHLPAHRLRGRRLPAFSPSVWRVTRWSWAASPRRSCWTT
jgi:aldehyde dehydrogenase (NAD+)